MLAQPRERGAIDSLGAQDVDVVKFCELLGGEGLGGTKRHMARVMDDDIEVTLLGDDLANGRITGCVDGHIHFDGPQVYLVLLRVLIDRLNLG